MNAFQQAICAGIPAEIPAARPYDTAINHAPRRKKILTPEEEERMRRLRHSFLVSDKLQAHMDTMLTVMVKRASPAARRMLGMVKLEGQMNSETMLNHTITSSAIA